MSKMLANNNIAVPHTRAHKQIILTLTVDNIM